MAEPEVKQILCMKWGTRYGVEYVNRLYGMVSRNITPPFRVICFTDDRTGVRPEVECYDLPQLECEIPTDVPGKWPKSALWAEHLFDLSGLALFIDLDVVITGNLDDFFSYGSPDDVITARNWVRPFERLGQTSIFRFTIGKHHYMLDDLRKDSIGISRRYRYEQRYVTQCVRGGVKFWPGKWVRHFKMSCMGPWPMRYLRAPRLPAGARVVIFPGTPNPEDALLGRWSPKHPPRTRWQHLKWLRADKRMGKSWYGHLRHFILPCPWIAEHWRE